MRRLMVPVLLAYLCFSMGNLLGDQRTLRDCATQGKAKMMGGGSIDCSIQRIQDLNVSTKQ